VNNYSGGPFVNGYYGNVTYELSTADCHELLETLGAAINAISANPADGQMTARKQWVNANHRQTAVDKVKLATALVTAGKVRSALAVLGLLEQKADCDRRAGDWFVCGSDAQQLIVDAIGEIRTCLSEQGAACIPPKHAKRHGP
jgi:hypothetical protein